MIAVPITQRQSAALLGELPLHHDLLAKIVGEREIVGSVEALTEVARLADNVAEVAEAIGQPRRANHMRRVLERLAAAGIAPERGGEAQEGIEGSGVIAVVPESSFANRPVPKKLHPSKRNRVWFEVETLRKGRPAGSRPRKRKMMAQGAGPAMVRGDGVFWHDERRVIDGERVTIQTPNNELTVALRAGSDQGQRAASLSRRRAGERAAAKQRAMRKPPERIAEAALLLNAKGRRVTPSQVARLMVVDDLRCGRYKFKSAKQRAAHQRYLGRAKQVLPTIELPVVVEQVKRSSMAAAAKRQRVEPIARHQHEWRVSPKRVKRSCACGAVERKRRGRWVAVLISAPARESACESALLVERLVSLGISRSEAERRAQRFAGVSA